MKRYKYGKTRPTAPHTGVVISTIDETFAIWVPSLAVRTSQSATASQVDDVWRGRIILHSPSTLVPHEVQCLLHFPAYGLSTVLLGPHLLTPSILIHRPETRILQLRRPSKSWTTCDGCKYEDVVLSIFEPLNMFTSIFHFRPLQETNTCEHHQWPSPVAVCHNPYLFNRNLTSDWDYFQSSCANCRVSRRMLWTTLARWIANLTGWNGLWIKSDRKTANPEVNLYMLVRIPFPRHSPSLLWFAAQRACSGFICIFKGSKSEFLSAHATAYGKLVLIKSYLSSYWFKYMLDWTFVLTSHISFSCCYSFDHLSNGNMIENCTFTHLGRHNYYSLDLSWFVSCHSPKQWTQL